MRLKSRNSNLEFLNTLRGELSSLDTRISNLTLNSSTKIKKKPESLPPLSTKRPVKFQNHPTRIFKSIDPGCYKEINFLEKYFNLPSKTRPKKKQINTLSRPKFPKFQPKILPKATRVDPESNPVLITEEDMQKGIYSLVNLGIATRNSEVFKTLSKENPPLMHSKVLLHNFSIQLEPLKLTKDKNKGSKKLNFIFSEPIIPNKEPVTIIKNEPKGYSLKIVSGNIINDSNYAEFLQSNPTSDAIFYLNQLKSASKQYNLPLITINTLNIPSNSNLTTTEAIQLSDDPSLIEIIQQQIENEAIKIAKLKAAVKVQSMWRRYKGAARMRRHKLEKSKIHIIEVQYKKYKKKVFTKQFAANLREARSNKFSQRQIELKSSWPELKHKNLIEVHIGSRFTLFPVPANQQIFRFFLLNNPKISMIYISLQGIDIDVFKYFEVLLRVIGISFEERLKIIRPYTLCKNLMSDTSKALYLSLHDLVDLKYENKGKDLVLVPFETNEYDEFLGDFLKVPIMGPVASIFQRFNKLVRWETLNKAGLNGIEGDGGVWDFQEFNESLRKLKEKSGNLIENWEIWTNGLQWNGQPWDNFQEVVINAKYNIPSVLCCLFIDPMGELTQTTSVEILPGNNSYLFPQSILPHSFLSDTISTFTKFLSTQGIFGYLSLQVCSKGIIDFEIGFNNNLPINIFFNSLMKGEDIEGNYYIAAQNLSEMEQEEYIDENSNFVRFENFEFLYLNENPQQNKENRVYVWVPFLFHEDLKGQKLTSIFHMCRLESVLFSLSKAEGTIFLPYSDLENGCVGVMGVGIDLEEALEFVAQGIFILKQGCLDESKGNLGSIAKELNLTKKIEEFQKLSEDNQFLLKLL